MVYYNYSKRGEQKPLGKRYIMSRFVMGIADMSILAKQGYIGTADLISPVETEQLSVVAATYRRLRAYFLGLEHTIRIFNMTTGEVYDLPCLLSYDIDEFIKVLRDDEEFDLLYESAMDSENFYDDDCDDFEDDWD